MRKATLTFICLLLAVTLFAQGKEFVGKVIIEDTEISVAEASIVAKKGAKAKTITNHEGIFFIPNVKSDFTLTISSKGLVRYTCVVKLSDGLEQVFNMQKDESYDELFDDNYGYTKSAKMSDPGGGVNIDSDASGAMTEDMVYAQLRRIPGVTVSGGRIMVRGPSSVNSSNEPLWVIDGVRSTGDGLANVDPTTIVKIEVLKGSAASLYGAQGATGVILITTRYK